MSIKSLTLVTLLCLLLLSCENFLQDEFEPTPPQETQVKIGFPGLVEFNISQRVIPNNLGALEDISIAYSLANELDFPINQLTFNINIFDSEARFDSNLMVSFADSLTNSLAPFGSSAQTEFNDSYSERISKDKLDIQIIRTDVFTEHPFSGIYQGEALFYMPGDSLPKDNPSVRGTIDYNGDLILRVKGNVVPDYLIEGRVGTTGLFNGKAQPNGGTMATENLNNSSGMTPNFQSGQLIMTFYPNPPPNTTSTIDSIRFLLDPY